MKQRSSGLTLSLPASCLREGGRELRGSYRCHAVIAIPLNQMSASEIPVLLILEDLHLLYRPNIHEQLGFIIEHSPPHVHVVVSTRADPGLPLAKLRVRGECDSSYATLEWRPLKA